MNEQNKNQSEKKDKKNAIRVALGTVAATGMLAAGAYALSNNDKDAVPTISRTTTELQVTTTQLQDKTPEVVKPEIGDAITIERGSVDGEVPADNTQPQPELIPPIAAERDAQGNITTVKPGS